jgi:hypothetical protein
VSTKTTFFVEVRFELTLDLDNVPPTYQDTDCLEEVLQEAIKEAVYDAGAEKINEFFIELVSEE